MTATTDAAIAMLAAIAETLHAGRRRDLLRKFASSINKPTINVVQTNALTGHNAKILYVGINGQSNGSRDMVNVSATVSATAIIAARAARGSRRRNAIASVQITHTTIHAIA